MQVPGEAGCCCNSPGNGLQHQVQHRAAQQLAACIVTPCLHILHACLLPVTACLRSSVSMALSVLAAAPAVGTMPPRLRLAPATPSPSGSLRTCTSWDKQARKAVRERDKPKSCGAKGPAAQICDEAAIACVQLVDWCAAAVLWAAAGCQSDASAHVVTAAGTCSCKAWRSHDKPGVPGEPAGCKAAA